MGMNKSTGNMYEFVTHTWNPLGGACPHRCSYCSTERLKKRYKAINDKYSGLSRLFEKELRTNLGKGNFIFVCGQNDLFADNIKREWILKVLNYCKKYDNSYLFQSKNPFVFNNTPIFPNKSIFCTTIETNRFYNEIMGVTPLPHDRAFWMPINNYITIEPIMDFDLIDFLTILRIPNPIQVNIGADSGNNHLPEPPKDKILELITELEKFTIVKQKKNLSRLLK